MLFGMNVEQDYSVFARRRQELWAAIEHKFSDTKKGCIVISAAFESHNVQFRQDSTFYYLTGINEPACVLIIEKEGQSTLFVPQYSTKRALWVTSELDELIEDPAAFGLDSVELLGNQIAGYQAAAWMPLQSYANLFKKLREYSNDQEAVFADMPPIHNGSDARVVIERIVSGVPGLQANIYDISSCIANMRRTKDMGEIEFMSRAVEMTVLAQEAAAHAIAADVLECEVQGQVDYIFTASGARASFPTIVASGQNSTILHYTVNCAQLQPDDLVVVDCGADVDHYCSDLSRTYPVSGKFNPRQRELYTIVLELQEYIAKLVKPGYFFTNPNMPEKSLNHLAKEFLAKKGLDSYFIHGIGHFLGLDVHDVGDINDPLDEGDMITIEPGLYIPDEKIGIRIEDDYWITKNGAICLSEALPKKPDEIEALMKGQISACFDGDNDEGTDQIGH